MTYFYAKKGSSKKRINFLKTSFFFKKGSSKKRIKLSKIFFELFIYKCNENDIFELHKNTSNMPYFVNVKIHKKWQLIFEQILQIKKNNTRRIILKFLNAQLSIVVRAV